MLKKITMTTVVALRPELRFPAPVGPPSSRSSYLAASDNVPCARSQASRQNASMA